MVAFPFFRYLVVAIMALPLVGMAQSNDKPETQVANVLACNTSFTDDMYPTYTWQTFTVSELAKKPIDYRSIDYNLLNAAVFYYTNKFRESRHLEALLFSAQLRDAAVFHSLEMVNKNFYAHIDTKLPAMRDPSKRAKYFKYPSSTVGENIAQQFLINYEDEKGFTTKTDGKIITYTYAEGRNKGKDVPVFTYGEFAEQIVKQWINSPPHRENMLGKDYTFMGCGIYASAKTMTKTAIPTAFGTQEFGGVD